MQVSVGGSARSELARGYNLIPPQLFRRVGGRFDLGAKKYKPGNWKIAIHASRGTAKLWCIEAYNHGIEHMLKMNAGEEPDEDHLGAIGFMVAVLAYTEDYYKCRWTEL